MSIVYFSLRSCKLYCFWKEELESVYSSLKYNEAQWLWQVKPIGLENRNTTLWTRSSPTLSFLKRSSVQSNHLSNTRSPLLFLGGDYHIAILFNHCLCWALYMGIHRKWTIMSPGWWILTCFVCEGNIFPNSMDVKHVHFIFCLFLLFCTYMNICTKWFSYYVML